MTVSPQSSYFLCFTGVSGPVPRRFCGCLQRLWAGQGAVLGKNMAEVGRIFAQLG